MAATLKTKINVGVTVVTSEAIEGLKQSRVEEVVSAAIDLLNGTSNAQANLAYVGERTLASGATEDLDLAGALTSALGATITMAEVVAVLIIADAANTTNLTIGGASSEAQLWFAAAGDKEVIKPGGISLHYAPAGWAITAGSADDLLIANGSGASATYQIAIIGRNA